MGGYGSGRHNSRFPTSGGLLGLDIRYLRKRGYFTNGAKPGEQATCSVEWSRRGEPSGTISVILPGTEAPYPPEIDLSYRTQARGESTWTDVRERVAIETTKCHYGGERPWFLCPQCESRRAVLFSVGGRFRCRTCHRVAYSSTRETVDDRCIRRAVEIKKRMGGHTSGSVFDREQKPPHMHWSTYARLCDELSDLGYTSMQQFLTRFGKLEGKAGTLTDLARAL